MRLKISFSTFLCSFALLATAQADDCQFIRDRVAKAGAAGGGVVIIPDGSYTCDTAIVLNKSHVTLRGASTANVLLRLADHSNAPVVVLGDLSLPPKKVEDVEVAHLTIDGNRDNQEHECWGGNCFTSPQTFIHNNGVTVRGVTDGRVYNIVAVNARSGGIVVEQHSRRLHVKNFLTFDNFYDGFAGYETEDSIFEDMVLSYSNAAGISLDLNFNKNTFRNVDIVDTRDVGIFMRHSNSNLFDNVNIRRSFNFGVFVSNIEGDETCANYNTFNNLTVDGSEKSGFRLNSQCAGNKLTGLTQFVNNKQSCIELADGAALDTSEAQLICRKD